MTDASSTPDGALMVIGGEDVAAHSGEWLETRDPASGRVIGRVPRGTAADVRAARAAHRAWGALPWRGRGAVLAAIGDPRGAVVLRGQIVPPI